AGLSPALATRPELLRIKLVASALLAVMQAFQARLCQQRLAQDVLFHDLFQATAIGRQLVVDGEAPLGDGDLVAGGQRLLLDAQAVDLDSISAVEVADVPVAVPVEEFAVDAGDVGEAHADVAGLAPAHRQGLADQGDRVAAPDGDELTVWLVVHEGASWVPN